MTASSPQNDRLEPRQAPNDETVLAFAQVGDFAAYHSAVDWLEAAGFSVGRMQARSPSGILRGAYDIQKWRNLSPADRAALDGLLLGDFRNGPVTIHLKPGRAPFQRITEPADVAAGHHILSAKEA